MFHQVITYSRTSIYSPFVFQQAWPIFHDISEKKSTSFATNLSGAHLPPFIPSGHQLRLRQRLRRLRPALPQRRGRRVPGDRAAVQASQQRGEALQAGEVQGEPTGRF